MEGVKSLETLTYLKINNQKKQSLPLYKIAKMLIISTPKKRTKCFTHPKMYFTMSIEKITHNYIQTQKYYKIVRQ